MFAEFAALSGVKQELKNRRMSKSGGLEYTKVAEIRPLLVVDEGYLNLKAAVAGSRS